VGGVAEIGLPSALLARKSDAGWGICCTMLKYKAEMVGKVYRKMVSKASSFA